jgi:hypothetical protein
MIYQVGDKVKVLGESTYGNVDNIIIPNETIGTIINVRERYKNTPNAYNQYRVKFDNYKYPSDDGLHNLYEEYAIGLYK